MRWRTRHALDVPAVRGWIENLILPRVDSNAGTERTRRKGGYGDVHREGRDGATRGAGATLLLSLSAHEAPSSTIAPPRSHQVTPGGLTRPKT